MSEKMNIGPEIRPEIKEIVEGSIVEGVSFEVSGGETKVYKSSSPDRKIIVLEDSSSIPESGEAYRVVIIRDTDPENPMHGKFMARIIPDEEDGPISEDEESVSYLGVRLEKAKNRNSQFVPDREKYGDYVNDTKVALPLQRDIAVAWSLGDPIAVESGTSFGKTTTVRKMASELGWEVHYINLNGATDVEDLMGRYIPNPNKNKPEDPEYVFADGKVTSGLRQEEGKVKVIILDEFNSSAPNILIRLHEVLDALERGNNVVLSEDASETITVSKQKTKVIALMNPPGQGYLDRKPLDPAQLRRWVYKKMPTELPNETFRQATGSLFGIGSGVEMLGVPEDMFLRNDSLLSVEQLSEIPGIEEILQKYYEFHKTAKELLKNRKIAEDQPQSFTYDDREEPRRVRDFILRFYNGDINETFQKALRYYYVNKLESDVDRKKLEEIIRLVEVKFQVKDSKRKGVERKKKKEEKKEKTEEKAGGDKSKEGLGKVDDDISDLEKFTRVKKRELGGEIFKPEITAEHKTIDEGGKEGREIINIDFEAKLRYSLGFYKSHKIEIPEGFEEKMIEIWGRNYEKIKEEIENNGFDEVLLIPEGLNTADIHAKISEGYDKTYEGSNFIAGGSFDGVMEDKQAKIILVHKNNAQNLKDHQELKKTLGKKAEELMAQGENLSLASYLVFQRQYFEATKKHLDESGWTWLPGSTIPNPSGGSRVVYASWRSDGSRLGVGALATDSSRSRFGCRLSRSFF